ncbi:hypothetical protein IQ07DRAFT_677847 [Pyrenochaeta sp. DS3sAY3a]|nr:hypothetical protein IQ07DRAFT_677847 [Pyrenochaeta sp. DS3sAY3a]
MSTDKGKGKKREVEEEIIPSTEPVLKFPLYTIKYPVKRKSGETIIEEGYTTDKKDRDWCAYFGWKTVEAFECTTADNRRECMLSIHRIYQEAFKPVPPATVSLDGFAKLWMNPEGEVDRDFSRNDNIATIGLGIAMYTQILEVIQVNAKKGAEWKKDHPRLLDNKAAELAKKLEDIESQLTVAMIRDGLPLAERAREDVRKQMEERASRQPSEEE